MPEGIPFGEYFLQRRLGAGGMAEVFLAKRVGPEGFEKQLVIKRILPHLSVSSDLTAMFLKEARLAARLDHPNLVHVSDFGRVDDRYYLAMEYVDGMTVAEVLSLSSRLPVDAACRVALDVLEALHAVHTASEAGESLGLVHRDVSPSNVMITRDGAVKLLDLGIAIGGDEGATGPAGTQHYMASEQLRGQSIDARADLYALGVLLHRMITGARPTEPPGPCPDDIPEALWLLLQRAMADDPEQRPASAREFSYALEQSVTLGAGARARLSHLLGALEPSEGGRLASLSRHLTAMVTGIGTQLTGERSAERPLRRQGLRWGMAAMVLLLGGAVVVAVVLPSGNGGKPEPPPAMPLVSPAPAAPEPMPEARREPERQDSPVPVRPRRRARVKAKSRGPKPAVADTPAPKAPDPPGDGFLTIDTKPWTEVYFRGQKLGLTPMERIALPPGAHQLELRNSKLGLERTVTVTITSGEVTTRNLRL